MEIALIIILFLIGTVGGAIQALKYVERRRQRESKGPAERQPPD